MKKFLVLMLVFAMASLASATTVSIIEPATGPGSALDPLDAGETLRVSLAVDAADLDTLIATISATNATINGGILAVEALNYGLGVTDYGVVMVPTLSTGWQSDLSFDTAVIGGNAHIGLGHAGNLISGPTSIPALSIPLVGGELGAMVTGSTAIAYIDITAAGTGDVVLSIVNGSMHGTSSLLIDLSTVPDFAGGTIAAVPEPATMILLGLGGLLLRRKK